MELYTSKLKLAAFIVLFAVVIFLGISSWNAHRFIAWLFITLGAVGTISLFILLLRKPGKILKADEQGIYLYTAIFKKDSPYIFFPWQEIKQIKQYHIGNQKFLALEIFSKDALLAQQSNPAAQKALVAGFREENTYLSMQTIFASMSLAKLAEELNALRPGQY